MASITYIYNNFFLFFSLLNFFCSKWRLQVLVELDSKEYNEITPVTDTNNTLNASVKKRKKDSPSPIALEPCAGNKAAVLSLLVRMPTGKKTLNEKIYPFLYFIPHRPPIFFHLNKLFRWIFNFQLTNSLWIIHHHLDFIFSSKSFSYSFAKLDILQ